MNLLERVLQVLFPPRSTEQVLRTSPDAALFGSATPTLTFFGDLEVTTLLPYRDAVVRACIVEAKYHAGARARTLLAQVLRDYLEAFVEDADALQSAPHLLVPIPLSAVRRRERGYNQVEEVAKGAGTVSGITLVPNALRRTRDTSPQTTLGRAKRIENMHDAFEAGVLDPAATYIVLDDVATTGATLAAAVAALRAAGATRTAALALAH